MPVVSTPSQENNVLLEALLDASPVGQALLDRDLRYVRINPRLADINGQTVGAHLGKSVREMLPHLANEIEPKLAYVIATGEPLRDLEVHAPGGDDAARYWMLNAFPVRDRRREIIGVGLAVVDITGQKRIEAHLRQAEARFRSMVDANIIGVVLAETDRIVEANQAFLSMVGYTRDDLDAGRLDWQAMTPPEYHDRDQQAMAELTQRGACTPFEKEYVRGDGTRVPILIGASLLEPDPLRAMCFVVDLSGRKRVEKELADLLKRERRAREGVQRLQAVTAGLAQAATPADVAEVIITQGLAVLEAEAGALVLLDATGEWLDLVHSLGYPFELVAAWERLPLNSPLPTAEAVRRRSPIWRVSAPLFPARPVAFSRSAAVVPLVTDHSALGALVLNFQETRTLDADEQDLTLTLAAQAAQALERARLYEFEQRAREEAEAGSRAREEFVAIISHDLRTPLATLKGSVQLLRRRLNRGESAQALLPTIERLEVTVETLARQLDELLDASRVRAGRPLELAREWMDLVALVRETVSIVEPQSGYQAFVVDVRESELVGYWDRLRLQRVLENLLGNAVKYSPAGGSISLTVAQDDGWAILSVRDEGLGIPAADVDRVFEPFQRGSNVVDQIAGTGLGLAGVRQVIAQHGGTIRVESVEGQGSTFVVRLPIGDKHEAGQPGWSS